MKHVEYYALQLCLFSFYFVWDIYEPRIDLKTKYKIQGLI